MPLVPSDASSCGRDLVDADRPALGGLAHAVEDVFPRGELPLGGVDEVVLRGQVLGEAHEDQVFGDDLAGRVVELLVDPQAALEVLARVGVLAPRGRRQDDVGDLGHVRRPDVDVDDERDLGGELRELRGLLLHAQRVADGEDEEVDRALGELLPQVAAQVAVLGVRPVEVVHVGALVAALAAEHAARAPEAAEQQGQVGVGVHHRFVLGARPDDALLEEDRRLLRAPHEPGRPPNL